MDKNPHLLWALWYREKMNFSVFPVIPGGKKPLIPWQKYQSEHATSEQIIAWWTETPKANIGIITGRISGVDVIDIDSEDGRKNIEPFLSDSFLAPTVNTPRGGLHYYCIHQEGSTNKAGVIGGTDFRGEGGYVVAPPSMNGNGKHYRWEENLKIGIVEIPPLPDAYFKHIINSTLGGDYKGGVKTPEKQILQSLQFLQSGTRDNDLFHAMNCLARGGYEKEFAYKVAEIIAERCNPPFSIKESMVKVDSAYERKGRSEKNVAQLFRDYCSLQDSYINLTDAYETLQFLQAQEKAACQVEAHRMCKGGLLEKVSRGCFKKIEKDCPDIDVFSPVGDPLNIKYPLGIHDLINTLPKNILVIAGEPNAGKTAYLLNFAQMNCGKDHEVVYFSSEMGSSELQGRLKKFNLPMHEWKKIVWKERAEDFASMIRPNAINIIDFMEVHEDFFKVGLYIKQIFDKLDKGIAFIAIQKNKGKDEGLGGMRSLEKARLYLAMEPGKLKIVKAKNWRNDEINPNGLSKRYKLGGGCNFVVEKDKNGIKRDWEKE
jgi:hypothetical protein